MAVHTLAYTCHTAYVDPMTGVGVLVLPRSDDDVTGAPAPKSYPLSLHEAEFGSVVRQLGRQGWWVLDGEDGEWMEEGRTEDGCLVIALYGDSIQSGLGIVELMRARGEVCRAARVSGLHRQR